MAKQTNRVGKTRLLEVAEQLFTEHGYQAVSIRDIAQVAGVTNAALYYYFPNKSALFGEVLEYHVSKLGECLQAAGATGKTVQEKISAMLVAYGEHVAERRSPFFSLKHKSPDMTAEQARDHHGRVVAGLLKPIEDELRIAIENGELKSHGNSISPAALLLGLFHGMLQHRHTCDAPGFSQSDVEIVVDIFWNGMKAI